jgi:hypothetical protein
MRCWLHVAIGVGRDRLMRRAQGGIKHAVRNVRRAQEPPTAEEGGIQLWQAIAEAVLPRPRRGAIGLHEARVEQAAQVIDRELGFGLALDGRREGLHFGPAFPQLGFRLFLLLGQSLVRVRALHLPLGDHCARQRVVSLAPE